MDMMTCCVQLQAGPNTQHAALTAALERLGSSIRAQLKKAAAAAAGKLAAGVCLSPLPSASLPPSPPSPFPLNPTPPLPPFPTAFHSSQSLKSVRLADVVVRLVQKAGGDRVMRTWT